MKIGDEIKFDFNDVVIVPKVETEIRSREECIPYTKYGDKLDGNLPLIAAPMDTVVSVENYYQYVKNGIIPCIPRGQYRPTAYNHPISFHSFGLCDVQKSLYGTREQRSNSIFKKYNYILIDIANGHMKKLRELVGEIKLHHPNVVLMVGNVAHPDTYVALANAGADYVRCSIGTGAGCTTAANVAINYPTGSLITECREKKIKHGLNAKIVADGGMRNYSDIIKALALGADYVMIGSLFNKAIESAGFNYLYGVKISDKLAKTLWRYNFPVKKKYRGMSTKAVQRSWGKTKLVTAEGITKYQKVEYTLEQWTENFIDYLKSDMSYSNAKTLNDFIGLADYCQITKNAYDRFNK